MRRIPELEKTIRDAQIIGIQINMEYSSKESQQEKQISLHFARTDSSEFKVILTNPSSIDYIEDFSSQWIGTIKCFDVGNKVQISLDPYDENIDQIADNDNFKISCDQYEIIELNKSRKNESTTKPKLH